jgi:hypothetical protein
MECVAILRFLCSFVMLGDRIVVRIGRLTVMIRSIFFFGLGAEA